MFILLTDKSLLTSRRVSSGFGTKSSLPLTSSIYKGGSCSTKGRTCFMIGGLRFSKFRIVISACRHFHENSWDTCLGVFNVTQQLLSIEKKKTNMKTQTSVHPYGRDALLKYLNSGARTEMNDLQIHSICFWSAIGGLDYKYSDISYLYWVFDSSITIFKLILTKFDIYVEFWNTYYINRFICWSFMFTNNEYMQSLHERIRWNQSLRSILQNLVYIPINK